MKSSSNKTRKKLVYLGFALLLLSILLNDVMDMTYQFGLFGFAVGWLGAIWFQAYTGKKQFFDLKKFGGLVEKVKNVIPNFKK
jgi:hypothetical protein